MNRKWNSSMNSNYDSDVIKQLTLHASIPSTVNHYATTNHKFSEQQQKAKLFNDNKITDQRMWFLLKNELEMTLCLI